MYVSDVRPPGSAAVAGRYVTVSHIPPMLSLPAHVYILIDTRKCPSYRENYCLCLLVGVYEEGRNMFSHTPVTMYQITQC
jgi:hypothetical protein